MEDRRILERQEHDLRGQVELIAQEFLDGFKAVEEIGSRVRLGRSAVLEITAVCEPCFRMDEIRDGLKDELEGRRGMVSRVVRGGIINVGDAITVERSEPLAS